jgi:hypothetical protein
MARALERRDVDRQAGSADGSSVEQIDRTHGHMLPDSEDHLRGLLDTFDAESGQAAKRESGR